MICIKPMAPAGEVALAAPRLSACMTARTHASGRPNRWAATAIYAAHLSIVGEPFWGATVAPRPNDALQLSSPPSGTNNSALRPSAQAVKMVIRSITDLSGSASEGSAQLWTTAVMLAAANAKPRQWAPAITPPGTFRAPERLGCAEGTKVLPQQLEPT